MAEQAGPRYYIVRWMLGGAAFGVAFPLIAWWVASSQLGTLTFSELHQHQPVMWVVDLAPSVMGIAGLAIGLLHQRLVAARTATEEVARQIAASWTADLHRANEELAQTLQDREKFYASVSHEFRTPLSAIIGYSSLTEEVAVAPPELGGYLTEIYSSAAALLELVNDLLDASKLDGNGIQMEISDVAANDVVSDVARLLRPLALQKGLDFVIDLQAESLSRADPIRLRQILNNLVANAIKYSERGPIVLRTYSDDDRRVIVEVEDNGVGISDDDIETIFLPFAQAAAGQRTRDATGLGLSICRTFADAMGANISVQSGGPGHGSVFRLSLEAGNGLAESAMASFSTTA